MKQDTTIIGIEIHEIEREVRDMGSSHMYPAYEPGTKHSSKSYALRIRTACGIEGETVSSNIETSSIPLFADYLLGRNALRREEVFNEVKRTLRHYGRMGLSTVDICLWDIAGKYYDAPVWELLGGYRDKLPVYASTTHGDYYGGLDSPEAYADFAEQCLEMGYKAFKIHPWWKDTVEKEVATILALGKRVGDRMDLMIDPSCEHNTFADAIKIGKACDEAGFFWLEDPFRDGGISQFANKQLKQHVKTPLLLAEHIRTVEQRMDFLLSGATDFIRGDVHMEGITGTMKLAHAAEAVGMDIELHGAGPASRHCIAAIRNTNYMEWGLVHPKVKPISDVHGGSATLYLDGYADGVLTGIDKGGCVSVPNGPGLGAQLNWDYIAAHRTGLKEFK